MVLTKAQTKKSKKKALQRSAKGTLQRRIKLSRPNKNDFIMLQALKNVNQLYNAPASNYQVQNSVNQQLINSLREDLSRNLAEIRKLQDKNINISQTTQEKVIQNILSNSNLTPKEKEQLINNELCEDCEKKPIETEDVGVGTRERKVRVDKGDPRGSYIERNIERRENPTL